MCYGDIVLVAVDVTDLSGPYCDVVTTILLLHE